MGIYIRKASLATPKKPNKLKRRRKTSVAQTQTGAQINFKECALSIIFSQNWFWIPYQLFNSPKKKEINLLKMNKKSVDWIAFIDFWTILIQSKVRFWISTSCDELAISVPKNSKLYFRYFSIKCLMSFINYFHCNIILVSPMHPVLTK